MLRQALLDAGSFDDGGDCDIRVHYSTDRAFLTVTLACIIGLQIWRAYNSSSEEDSACQDLRRPYN